MKALLQGKSGRRKWQRHKEALMQAVSIVDDYIIRAIQGAEFEHHPDGGVAAWAPGFPGLIALGPDGRSCLNDLWRRLEEWIRASFEEGLALPVIDGIDLRSEDGRASALVGLHLAKREKGRFYESDEQFLHELTT